MERMRSRADPDALLVRPGSGGASSAGGGGGGGYDGAAQQEQLSDATGGGGCAQPLSAQPQSGGGEGGGGDGTVGGGERQRVGVVVDKQDEAFLLNTGLAQKRVRVAQLLIIGLMGLLLGWLGNFLVGTSCHFGSSRVQVGANGNQLTLHFGLWKYSPVDSAVSGYNYCYPYQDNGGSQAHQAPVVARAFNLAALLLGTYSQVVLWLYLIAGHAVYRHWVYAVYAAYAAGACQALTLLFFASTSCLSSGCTMGPGSAMAIVTAVSWIAFAFEMQYNRPVPVPDDSDGDNDGDNATSPTAPCSDNRSLNGGGGIGMDNDDAALQPPSSSGGCCYGPAMAADESTGSVVAVAAADDSVGVSSLEMADFQGASQEYIDRFNRNSSGSCTSPAGGYRPPELT